jgi:1-acyl-sn-glycerol-3-phosphate acyltransferase
MFIKKQKKLYVARCVSKYSKLFLKLLGIEVKLKHAIIVPRKKCLLVSNHVSYIDILAISSVVPAIFVTSNDVKNEFFTGFLSNLGGSIFVSRKPTKIRRKDVINIAKVLAHDCSVCLFPEATSSNGKTVLKFRSSLYESITILNGVVQPVYLKYDNDSIAYYGDMKFFEHLWNLFKTKKTKVFLDFCDPIFVNKLVSVDKNVRRTVCSMSYESILSKAQEV